MQRKFRWACLALLSAPLSAQYCYQFSGVKAADSAPFSTFVIRATIANPQSVTSIGGIVSGGFFGPGNSFVVSIDQTTQTFAEFEVSIIYNPGASGGNTTMTIAGGNLGSTFGEILLSGSGNLLPAGLPSVLPSLNNWDGNAAMEFSTTSTGYKGQITAISACGSAIAPPSPTINPGGIVPLYGSTPTIESGEWITIYGTNLATTTATWNNDFPTSLGGTSVTIDGKPAFLWYASPTQINLQVPDDPALGTVAVVVTTASGSVSGTATLAKFTPTFSLVDSKHVLGLIPRTDGSGAFGGGAYDILGPTGASLGYPTSAAKAGETVELYGVGFGPTDPTVPAGHSFSGSAITTSPVTVLINNVSVQPLYAGEVSAGLYQLNVTVPAGLGAGDTPIQAIVGGVQTQSGVFIPLDATMSSLQVKSVSFSLAVNVVGSGSPVVGTVVLSGLAPSGGVRVSLSSSSSAVSLPASVLIPGGSVAALFNANTGTVFGSQDVTITATYGGQSVLTSLTVTSATVSSPFTELIVIPTFQPTGYPTITTASFSVTPDAGNATYTACIDGCALGAVLLNGTTSDQGTTFTFNMLQSGGNNTILYAGSSTGLLQLSSISLTFSITQTSGSSTGGNSNGTITGTMTMTGTPYGATGSALTLSGPLSGNYSEIRP
jgi:uncharacterized protein (TIGR03437 family)